MLSHMIEICLIFMNRGLLDIGLKDFSSESPAGSTGHDRNSLYHHRIYLNNDEQELVRDKIIKYHVGRDQEK